jgi:putative DNA primase/helicase
MSNNFFKQTSCNKNIDQNVKNSDYSETIENLPYEMKISRNWVNIKGKKKIPIQLNGNPLKWIVPCYRYSFNEVKENAIINKPFIGVGFVFDSNGFLVIDLDNCLNDDKSLKEWAIPILDKINSFTEYSYSNKGLHIFCKQINNILLKGNKFNIGINKEGFEIYNERKVITVTGRIYNQRDTFQVINQTQIDEILEPYKKTNSFNKSAFIKTTLLTDKTDIEILNQLQKNKTFSELYKGNLESVLNDCSKADYKVAFYLSTKTKNYDQIERIISASTLAQVEHSNGTKKWLENPEYRKKTINKAINDSNASYIPPGKPTYKGKYHE